MAMAKREDSGLDRRDFLVRGASAVGAGLLGATGVEAFATSPEPEVRRYAPLGSTGMKIADISFGSSRTRDANVVRHAFARGINYFDSAERYPLEGSLRRLRTDYVDVYFNHAVNDVARMRNEEWHEFTELAKKQGKIRFRGISGHAGRLVECLNFALDQQLVDVILVAYNFGQDPAFYERLKKPFDFVSLQPDLPPVLARAHKEGVGVVAMKTLMGARLNDMRPYEKNGATFSQAAFRWVLSNPDVDALVVSMTKPEQVDEYLRASGAERVGRNELRLLEGYAARNGARYCQHGCSVCEESCPDAVAISEVLRTRMYDVDYGDRELARRDYAQLGAAASPCLGCDAPACAGACPNGLPIPILTRDAARRLG
jgi:predicted aldo/keto reductase-like oxidoreductase